MKSAEERFENAQDEMNVFVKNAEKKTEFLGPVVVALKAASSKLFGFDPMSGQDAGPPKRDSDKAIDTAPSLDVGPIVQMEEIESGLLKSPKVTTQSPGTAKSPQGFNPMMKKSTIDQAGDVTEFKAKAEVNKIPVDNITKSSTAKIESKPADIKQKPKPKPDPKVVDKSRTKNDDDILGDNLILKEIPPTVTTKQSISTDIIKSAVGASSKPHDFNPILKEGQADVQKLPEMKAKADLYDNGKGDIIKVEKETPGVGKDGYAPPTPGKSKESQSKPKDSSTKPASKLNVKLNDSSKSGGSGQGPKLDVKADGGPSTASAASVIHVDKNIGLKSLLESLLAHSPTLKPAIEQAVKLVENVKGEVEVLKKEFDERLDEEQEFCKILVDVMSREYELTLEEAQKEKLDLKKLVEEAKSELVKKEQDYKNEIVKRVDEERGGRLAKLEYLQQKLGMLEGGYQNAMDFVERNVGLNKEMGLVQKLKDKMAKGVDVKPELEILGKRGDEVTKVVLGSIGVTKVKTREELERGFERIYDDLYRAQFIPAKAGLISLITGYALTYLLIPKQGLVPGKAPDCVLSRAKFYVQQGDLDSAAREVNQLEGWSGLLANDWLENGRRYLELNQAVDVVETRLRLKRLNVLK